MAAAAESAEAESPFQSPKGLDSSPRAASASSVGTGEEAQAEEGEEEEKEDEEGEEEEEEEEEEPEGLIATLKIGEHLEQRLQKLDELGGAEDKSIEVDLTDQPLGDEGAARLRRGLAGKAPALRRLLLRRTGLGVSGFTDVGAIASECPALEVLVLTGNLAGPDCLLGELFNAVDNSRSLRTLELTGCDLGDAGIEPLCAALERWDSDMKQLTSLKRLVLGANKISSEGARRLGAMLSTARVLEELDISANRFCEEGGIAIAEGLRKNKAQLRWLDISQNRLKVAGTKPIVEVFMPSHPIFTIKLVRPTGTKVGMVLDSKMVVRGMEHGSVAEIYGAQNPSDVVVNGDRIIEVNGKTEPGEMTHALQTGEELTVTLTREAKRFEFLDLTQNLLGHAGAKELRKLVGQSQKGLLLGYQLRFDDGKRSMILDAT
ncbi:unnamed protein product [Polarella glacialis]|uniref:PDZ domain-containing protein n=1 Tax=Polarella glacialis TaxID=89957 RepID=A0A813HSZ4_POLGL|nr:unnamed protein product [Polarella glacialis]